MKTPWRMTLLAMLGTGLGMIGWALMGTDRVRVPPPDPGRMQAWDKISSRLRQSDQKNADSGAPHLQRIKDFFAAKQERTRDFAEDVLGWGGKWAMVKGKLTGDDGKSQQAHARQAFERHLFTGRDLQELMQTVITAYLSELEGQENALLVEIRADMDDKDLPALRSLVSLQSDEAFQGEYRKLLAQVSPTIARDLKITVGREAAVWVGSEIATVATVRIGSAVAVRLGVSSGILGTGAASGIATLGVGLVVGFVVDAAVDYGMRRAGYDPAGEIAGQVSGTLTRIETLLLDGDPESHSVFKELRRLQEHDRFSFVRTQCRLSADTIENGGGLGLRHELNRLRQYRSRLREEALRKLVCEGGTL